jgi:putative inorganic carbon (HCO3(-)) transporter
MGKNPPVTEALRVIRNSLLYVTIGIILGFWILTLLGFPLKWSLTLAAATLFGVGIWVFKDIERVLLVFLILAIPLNLDINFFIVEGHHAGMNSISIGLVDIFLILLIAHWIVRICLKNENKINWYPKITVPFAGMIVVASFSAYGAKDPSLSFFEIILFFKGLLIFLYFANRTRKESELRLILLCLTAGIFIQSIFGLLQHYSGSSLGLGILGESDVLWEQELQKTVSSRVGGTIGYTNDFAKYLSFFFPIIVSLLFSTSKKINLLFYLSTLVLLVLDVFFTLSRVAWVGMAFSAGIVFLFQRKNKLKRIHYPLIALLLIVLVLVSQIDLIQQRFSSEDMGSARSRFTTSAVAARMIFDHPLLGVGANNYQTIVAKYGDSRNPETFTMAVHNMYLLYLAETGIIGFGFFLWLNLNLFRAIWKSAHLSSAYIRSLGIGALGAYLSLFLQGFADFGVKHNEPRFFLFWLVVAAVVASMNSSVKPNHAILNSQNP